MGDVNHFRNLGTASCTRICQNPHASFLTGNYVSNGRGQQRDLRSEFGHLENQHHFCGRSGCSGNRFYSIIKNQNSISQPQKQNVPKNQKTQKKQKAPKNQKSSKKQKVSKPKVAKVIHLKPKVVHPPRTVHSKHIVKYSSQGKGRNQNKRR